MIDGRHLEYQSVLANSNIVPKGDLRSLSRLQREFLATPPTKSERERFLKDLKHIYMKYPQLPFLFLG